MTYFSQQFHAEIMYDDYCKTELAAGRVPKPPDEWSKTFPGFLTEPSVRRTDRELNSNSGIDLQMLMALTKKPGANKKRNRKK